MSKHPNPEGSYKDYLQQAKLALAEMAADAKTAAEKTAAEETAAALVVAEDARINALRAPDAPAAKRAFWQRFGDRFDLLKP